MGVTVEVFVGVLVAGIIVAVEVAEAVNVAVFVGV
jgi:hypothetical protein